MENRPLRLFHYLLTNAQTLTTEELIQKWDKIFDFDHNMQMSAKKRAIQRGLKSIEDALSDPQMKELFIYHKERSGKVYEYSIDYNGKTFINSQEALVLTKILLASRALNDQETTTIINKWQNMISTKARKTIKSAVNENFDNESYIIDSNDREKTIWKLEEYIQSRSNIRFNYRNLEVSGSPEVNEEILPLHVFFDNYYFFLKGYKFENNRSQFKTYRIDWMEDITKVKSKIKLIGQNMPQNSEEDPRVCLPMTVKKRVLNLNITVFPTTSMTNFLKLNWKKWSLINQRSSAFLSIRCGSKFIIRTVSKCGF
jgi:hypothetical protein